MQWAQKRGVFTSRTCASHTYWRKWMDLCVCLTLNPEIINVAGPITYLQIFAERVHMGVLVAGGAAD